MSECGSSAARDINDLGEIVGYSDIDPDPSVTTLHAFLYRNGAMVDLGVYYSVEHRAAEGVNDNTQIVGRTWNAGFPFPTDRSGVLWEDDESYNLEDLLVVGADEWSITNANAISGTGLIVGSGDPVDSMYSAGFLMRPVITIGTCNTDVLDRPYDEGMLSEYLNEIMEECAAGAKNHGQFVKCMGKEINALKKAGVISAGEKGAIQRCTAQADIF